MLCFRLGFWTISTGKTIGKKVETKSNKIDQKCSAPVLGIGTISIGLSEELIRLAPKHSRPGGGWGECPGKSIFG